MTEQTLAQRAEVLAENVAELHEVIGVVAAKSKRLRLIVFGLCVSLALGFAVGYKVVAVSNCQAAYVRSVTLSLQARDRAADRTRADAKDHTLADKQLWLGFMANSSPRAGQLPTQAQLDASLAGLRHYLTSSDAYVASLDNASRTGRAAPIPSEQC